MRNLSIILLFAVKSSASNRRRLLTLLQLIKFSIKKRLFRKGKEICEPLDGYRVCSYGYGNLDFLYREIFCLNEYYFQASSASPVIIDCGANIGMATVYFKKLYPASKILAFEASPKAYRLLDKNVRLNKFSEVSVFNIALYDRDTALTFFTNDNPGSGVGSIKESRGGNTAIAVSAQKLSGYLNSLEKIDLVKMDVEGAERNIIQDLVESGTITKPEQYIIEYHHNIDDDPANFSAFLEKFERNGYDYTIAAKFPPKGRYQDILIRLYKRRAST